MLDANRQRYLTPSRQFTALLSATLLLGGIGLALLTSVLVEQLLFHRVVGETEYAVQSHFASVFNPAVFSHNEEPPAGTPFDPTSFDRSVRFHLGVYDIVHARFVERSGIIVYSYDRAEIGQPASRFMPVGKLTAALHGQAAPAPAISLADLLPGAASERRTTEIVVPARRDGIALGAAWVVRDVTGIVADIRRTQLLLVALIALVGSFLYLALRQVFWNSTRTISDRTLALTGALAELRETYDATLRALGAALDSRDDATANHAARVTRVAVALAHEMGLAEQAVLTIERGAALHDIGKIGVPDAILRKPGPLTEAEWTEMRRHPTLGADMLAEVPFLHDCLPLVRHHHEWWNGSGYPDGLQGEAIPLVARVFAVADALDAMTSARPYRPALSLAGARAEIEHAAGTQFDPAVVAAFLRLEDAHLARLVGEPVAPERPEIRRTA